MADRDLEYQSITNSADAAFVVIGGAVALLLSGLRVLGSMNTTCEALYWALAILGGLHASRLAASIYRHALSRAWIREAALVGAVALASAAGFTLMGHKGAVIGAWLGPLMVPTILVVGLFLILILILATTWIAATVFTGLTAEQMWIKATSAMALLSLVAVLWLSDFESPGAATQVAGAASRLPVLGIGVVAGIVAVLLWYRSCDGAEGLEPLLLAASPIAASVGAITGYHYWGVGGAICGAPMGVITVAGASVALIAAILLILAMAALSLLSLEDSWEKGGVILGVSHSVFYLGALYVCIWTGDPL